MEEVICTVYDLDGGVIWTERYEVPRCVWELRKHGKKSCKNRRKHDGR